MNNMNFDEKAMENIKNMVDNGNISDAISQISPEMIQNFSKMFSSSNANTEQKNNNEENTSEQTSSINNSNIDINTIMKMSSAINKMGNSKNDPRVNLLNSLKPYLRDGKKNKLDNYMNLLNVSKIAEIMKNNNNKQGE